MRSGRVAWRWKVGRMLLHGLMQVFRCFGIWVWRQFGYCHKFDGLSIMVYQSCFINHGWSFSLLTLPYRGNTVYPIFRRTHNSSSCHTSALQEEFPLRCPACDLWCRSLRSLPSAMLLRPEKMTKGTQTTTQVWYPVWKWSDDIPKLATRGGGWTIRKRERIR